MSTDYQAPLVGPLKRRGPRALLRLEPLTRTPHAALVVTRRGHLVGVIPAGGRRTLSDYLDWPSEVREVDMRERPLLISQRCDSSEAGYVFNVTLQLTYRVARPERVALGHVDVLRELEEAVAQRARAVAATLGVEQTSALKEYLQEALVAGNELPQRFEDLGLSLCRADVAVELGASERERAESLREQSRDRPLLARFRLETADPEQTFDVQVGGFYRVRSREAAPSLEDVEELIRAVAAKSLSRISVAFQPAAYREAAAAMTEELWSDGVLKAELAAADVELLRPAIHIYPNRDQLALAGRPLLLEDGRERDTRFRRIGMRPRLALAAPQAADAEQAQAHAPADAGLTVDGEVVASAAREPAEEQAPPWASWRTFVGEVSAEVSPETTWWVEDDPPSPAEPRSTAQAGAGAPVDEPFTYAPVADDDDADVGQGLVFESVGGPFESRFAAAPAEAEAVFEDVPALTLAEVEAVFEDVPASTLAEVEAVFEKAPASTLAEVEAVFEDVPASTLAEVEAVFEDAPAPTLAEVEAVFEEAPASTLAEVEAVFEDVPALTLAEVEAVFEEAPASTLAEVEALEDVPAAELAEAEAAGEPDAWPELERAVGADAPPAEVAAPPAGPDRTLIDRWLRLLQSSGPALFKLWSLEISEEPARLPEIIGRLTADAQVVAAAADPAGQRALAEALDGATWQTEAPAPAAPPAAPAAAQQNQGDAPDWMLLRASVSESAEADVGRARGRS